MTTSGLLTMSRKELDRAEWMQRVHERRTTQAQVETNTAPNPAELRPVQRRLDGLSGFPASRAHTQARYV